MTKLFAALAFITIFIPRSVSGQESLRLGLDVDSASSIIDLAETPTGVSLLQSASLAFRDELLERKLNNEFADLRGMIQNVITAGRGGYLLEVSLYFNELGVAVIPGGQLISAVGPGLEPVDALAESLRRPQLRNAPPPAALRNASYHVWLSMEATGMVAKTIPSQFRGRLLEISKAEARRRDLLGAWQRASPEDTVKAIARAEFWIEVQRQREALIKDGQRRARVAQLTADMSALQSEMNGLYRQYQETERRLAEQGAHLRTLETIATVTDLISNGMQVGKLVSTANDKPVTGREQTPETNTPASMEWTRRVIEADGATLRAVETRVKLRFDEMKSLDSQLEGLYKLEGIPIPQRDWAPILPKP
jgi:hypothetical protein